jgi:hypothetical protein
MKLIIIHLKYMFFESMRFYKKIVIQRKRCSVKNFFLLACKLRDYVLIKTLDL